MSDLNEILFIDGDQAPPDTLERLKNISKMFSGRDDDQQALQKVEKIMPSDKIKRTFRKFEEIGSSIDQIGEDDGEEEQEQAEDNMSSNSTIRATKKKKVPKEHIPYHEMAEVKDKFEKGLIDANKPRLEKRLDVRVQSGLTSSKKQAFEQGEFERDTTSSGNKLDIETNLIAGLTSSKKQAFEQGEFERDTVSSGNKLDIETNLIAGLTSSKKQAFEQGEFERETRSSANKLDIETNLIAGLASSKKQAFEQGEFERDTTSSGNKLDIETNLIAGLASSKKQVFEKQQSVDHDNQVSNKAILLERDALAGVATGTKAKFENGQISDRPRMSICADEIATFLGTGLAQAKRSEILSKIDAEQQIQRAANRSIDLDAEQGIASVRRDQLASLANTEYRPTERFIDVTAGLANSIKEQYIADASRLTQRRTSIPPDDIESGLAKSLATVFEKIDEATVKRTVDMDNELVDCNVAKERLAMFKNLVNGSQSFSAALSADSKIRVDRVDFSDTLIKMIVRLKIKPTDMEKYILSIVSDEENGNVIRESDKLQEVYFEKGQTRQLVEQWKTKQISPEREIIADTEIVQQGKAKDLVQIWKTFDKENTPPSERRGLRAFTPPNDQERYIISSEDNDFNTEKSNQADDTANIESGYAKAIRAKFLQNTEQNHTIDKRKTLKQITPPPESPNDNRRKSLTPPDTNDNTTRYNEEIIAIKGQAQSLKNRFIELEQDAKKVETSSSKIKYVPKRFVNTPAPKQNSFNSINDSNKCSICCKTVNGSERIEADKKIYHKTCFKSEI